MIKQFVKYAFRKMGFDIRRIPKTPPVWQYPEPPEWMHTGPKVTYAEMEDVSYLFATLGNRVHNSKDITLRRTPSGEDYREKYILKALDVRGKRVLELGPYHGLHTFFLDKLGAAAVVAVEGREKNLRVCEMMKQRYGLDRATFVLQNIEALASGERPKFSGPFDLVFCLGLLYHVPDPISVLSWCRRQSDSLFLGTHYYEPTERERYEPSRFTEGALERDGKKYEGVWYKEGGYDDGPSGLSDRALWPSEADLVAMLRTAGYSSVSVLGRDLQAGWPHITLIANG
jgi:SAM-dependent methyltransferase